MKCTQEINIFVTIYGDEIKSAIKTLLSPEPDPELDHSSRSSCNVCCDGINRLLLSTPPCSYGKRCMSLIRRCCMTYSTTIATMHTKQIGPAMRAASSTVPSVSSSLYGLSTKHINILLNISETNKFLPMYTEIIHVRNFLFFKRAYFQKEI